MTHPSRTGFTLVELASCAAGAGIAATVCIGLIQPAGEDGGVRKDERRRMDQVHMRGIMVGCTVWAQNNLDRYPLPSVIDKTDQTVAEKGAAKDTSANIMSLLIFNGFVPVEILVSPVERNPSIRVCQGYALDMPKTAVNPANAAWDPAFSVDFTNGKTGGLSYAHLQPTAGRKARWSNTFVSTEATITMRGPQVSSVVQNEDGSVTPNFANPASLTFGMYGDGSGWSGNVGFNDNHVAFAAQSLLPGPTSCTTTSPTTSRPSTTTWGSSRRPETPPRTPRQSGTDGCF
jgi:hypothetical protein